MLSKSKISFIKSLSIKKFRTETGFFIVEGVKMVDELMNSSLRIKEIFATSKWEGNHQDLNIVSDKELAQISSLSTPNQVIAVVEISQTQPSSNDILTKLSLALDNVKDPGNMGTIIRLADWFGIENIICSEDCVDIYNPKVVQATMGSVFRIKTHYLNLPQFFKSIPEDLPVYGAVLDGSDIYQSDLSQKGVIVMGNESVGISDEILSFLKEKITIPSYGSGAESLNVAIATAIICAEFKRRYNN